MINIRLNQLLNNIDSIKKFNKKDEKNNVVNYLKFSSRDIINSNSQKIAKRK